MCPARCRAPTSSASWRPRQGEPVVDKLGYGGFHGTDLDVRLRMLGVRSLVITGTVTQICVEETAREAYHHGYAMTVVADAVSSFAPDLQAATLRNLAMKFGWVSAADDVVSALADAPLGGVKPVSRRR